MDPIEEAPTATDVLELSSGEGQGDGTEGGALDEPMSAVCLGARGGIGTEHPEIPTDEALTQPAVARRGAHVAPPRGL